MRSLIPWLAASFVPAITLTGRPTAPVAPTAAANDTTITVGAATARVGTTSDGRVVLTVTSSAPTGKASIADTASRDSAGLWADVTSAFMALPPTEQAGGVTLSHRGEWKGPVFGHRIRIIRLGLVPPPAATPQGDSTPSVPRLSDGSAVVDLTPELASAVAGALSKTVSTLPAPASKCKAIKDHVAGTAYDEGEVDRNVALLPDGPHPIPPQKFLDLKTQAQVGVEYVVDAKGVVDTASVSPFGEVMPELLTSVKMALSKTRFVPAQCGGEAVSVNVQQLFQFQ